MTLHHTMSRVARAALLIVLILAPHGGVPAASSARKTIAAAYATMDAAARHKKIADALVSFAPDWTGTAKTATVQLYPAQPDQRVTTALLYKQATKIEAGTRIIGFTAQPGGTIAVRVALHLVATQDMKNSADSVELTSDVTRDDTWEKRNGKWMITRSYTSKGHMEQVFFVIHTTPDQQPEEESASGPRVLKGYQGDVVGLVFTPDGATVIAGCKDNTIRFWDAASGQLTAARKLPPGNLEAMALSPDGTLLALASMRYPTPRTWVETVTLLDAKTAKVIRKLASGRNYVRSLAFAADGKKLCGGGDAATKGNSLKSEGLILQWDVATGKPLYAVKTKFGGVSMAIYRPAGPEMIAATDFVGPSLWQPSNGACIADLHDLGRCVAFSADGRILAAGGQSPDPGDEDASPLSGGYGHGKVELYDPDTHKPLRTLTWPDEEGSVRAVVFAPDGKTVAASTGLAVVIWNVETGKLVKHINDQYGGSAIAYSPDGKLLARQDVGNHIVLEPLE